MYDAEEFANGATSDKLELLNDAVATQGVDVDATLDCADAQFRILPAETHPRQNRN